MKQILRKIITDPGMIFSTANIFAFSQARNLPSLAVAIGTFALAAMECCLSTSDKKTVFSPQIDGKLKKTLSFVIGDKDSRALRINAYGTLIAGALSFASGAILPGIAGTAFSIGNFLASSSRVQMIQRDKKVFGAKKVFTNPAVLYGVGYVMIGLMAGGGISLLANPLAHIPALLTTSLGAATITLSSVGLALGKFDNPATPFMAVAFGNVVNVLSGIISGNALGSINNFLAMCGETRLGQINYYANKNSTNDREPDKAIKIDNICNPTTKERQKPCIVLEQNYNTQAESIDGFFRKISSHLLKPLEIADRVQYRRRCARAPEYHL